MEKKNNKGVVISLLIVIAVLIGSIAYMFISGIASFDVKKNNENKTEEKENNNEEVSEETISLSEDDKKMFMETLIPVYDNSEYTVSSYDASKLSNIDKIRFAVSRLAYDGYKPDSYTLDELLDVTKKHFGEAGSFEPENVNCRVDGKESLNYNNETKTFVKTGNHGHGYDEYNFDVVNKFVDGSMIKNDGEIQQVIVKVRKSFSKAVFADMYGREAIRYGTYDSAVSSSNPAGNIEESFKNVAESEWMDNYSEYCLKLMDQNPDAYPIHTYVFNYENGNYYLDSITIEK